MTIRRSTEIYAACAIYAVQTGVSKVAEAAGKLRSIWNAHVSCATTLWLVGAIASGITAACTKGQVRKISGATAIGLTIIAVLSAIAGKCIDCYKQRHSLPMPRAQLQPAIDL